MAKKSKAKRSKAMQKAAKNSAAKKAAVKEEAVQAAVKEETVQEAVQEENVSAASKKGMVSATAKESAIPAAVQEDTVQAEAASAVQEETVKEETAPVSEKKTVQKEGTLPKDAEQSGEESEIGQEAAEPETDCKETCLEDKKTEEAEAKAAEREAAEKEAARDRDVFEKRLSRHHDELRWLYMELYGNDSMFMELCEQMGAYYENRNRSLKNLDEKREQEPEWFKQKNMLGMMLYIDNFAGNLKGVREKLSYLADCNVNCIHLMPFLDTPEGRSDGGYAVADFRKVRPDLGTMEDLAELAEECHGKGMNLCMDFVMNHTSEDHEWAVKARQGDGEYMSRYFFYDNYDIPSRFEATVPQVFPTTAPGNFTWLPDI